MLQDIAILTGGQVITEEVGLKLENVTLDLLGKARKVIVTKDETTIVEGARRRRRHQGPHQPDQGRDREHRLRLRPGEAPGAPGQAVRRRRRHQGRRRHRGRAQGEEAPHRGRGQHHQGRGRGGRRPRRWRGPAAGPGQASSTLAEKLEGDEATGARIVARAARGAAEADRRQRRPRGRRRGRARCATSKRPTEGLNAATGEYEDLVKAGIIDAAKVTRSALQNAASIAALFLTTEAVIVDKPEKEGAPAMPGGGMEDF